jgi:hypothetical protein
MQSAPHGPEQDFVIIELWFIHTHCQVPQFYAQTKTAKECYNILVQYARCPNTQYSKLAGLWHGGYERSPLFCIFPNET